MTAQEDGNGDRGGGHDPGRDEQGQLHPVGEGDPGLGRGGPDTHDQLVRQAGYSYDQLEAWVRGTLSAALLAGG